MKKKRYLGNGYVRTRYGLAKLVPKKSTPPRYVSSRTMFKATAPIEAPESALIDIGLEASRMPQERPKAVAAPTAAPVPPSRVVANRYEALRAIQTPTPQLDR